MGALLTGNSMSSERQVLVGGSSYVFANQVREHWRRTNEGFHPDRIADV